MVPVPLRGRVFRRGRRVRLADVSPKGRLRLDAIARFLQDVSNDDTRDAGLANEMSWVVRRIVIDVHRYPVFGEELDLATFCGGIGGRWAERRVSVTGDRGGHVEAATLWVHLDPATLRPMVLPPEFHELFAESAGGRTVRARLEHDDPPATGGDRRPWPLRFADFDVLGHVNNAAYWFPVEEELARRREVRAPMRAELEYRQPIEPGDAVEMITLDDDASLALWLVGPTSVHATARVETT
jgi:acyl-ACP thioesterase